MGRKHTHTVWYMFGIPVFFLLTPIVYIQFRCEPLWCLVSVCTHDVRYQDTNNITVLYSSVICVNVKHAAHTPSTASTLPYAYKAHPSRRLSISLLILSTRRKVSPTINPDLVTCNTAGTFNMSASYQKWVWEREAHINWSMMTCQGSTRLELP